LAIGALFLASRSICFAADSGTPTLRYAFQTGQTYVYDLSIQIELPEMTETLAGLSKYQVKSVDAASGQITMTHSADLSRALRVSKPGTGPAMRGMRMGGMSGFSFANINSPCEIVIDPNGNIVRYERKSQLPYLLGNIWALTIEPLPPAGKNQWQTTRDMEVTDRETNSWFPRPMMNAATNWSATETIDYSIADASVDAPVITRAYALATTEQSDGEPVAWQKGQGTITFDSKAGAIRSLDETSTLRLNSSGVTVKIPISITATLLSAEEAEKKIADRKAAAEKAQRDFAESQKPKPIGNDGLDQLLASIKSSTNGQRHQALDKLAHSIPIEDRRDEVASVLVGLLSEHDQWDVTGAEKALKLWGNDSSVAPLITLLQGHDVFVRMGAMDALAPRKSALAADAVAKCLPENQVRQQAIQALKSMGEVAEGPVLSLLKNPEWSVRMSACDVLAEIGTSQSIEALKAATNDENGIVKMKAQDALKSIEARSGKGGPQPALDRI
jgi:hypothetical protein